MFRYPDKPGSEISRAALADLSAGYMAELKRDGFRMWVEKVEMRDHSRRYTYTSRDNNPLAVSGVMQLNFTANLDSLPVGTLLDCEWCGRRPGDRTESITVFDILKFGDSPLWQLRADQRFDILRMNLPAEHIVPMAFVDHEIVTCCSYQNFFDMMREQYPEAEGIVLKRRDSTYIGSPRACADNPAWVKCKWRAGEDGCTVIEKPHPLWQTHPENTL
jgi:ATP-dependent DNA ligase